MKFEKHSSRYVIPVLNGVQGLFRIKLNPCTMAPLFLSPAPQCHWTVLNLPCPPLCWACYFPSVSHNWLLLSLWRVTAFLIISSKNIFKSCLPLSHCSLFIFFTAVFTFYNALSLCLMFVSPLNCLKLLEGLSFLFIDTSSVSRKLPEVPLVPNLLNELINE